MTQYLSSKCRKVRPYQSGVTHRDDEVKEWLQSCLPSRGVLLHLHSRCTTTMIIIMMIIIFTIVVIIVVIISVVIVITININPSAFLL